MTGRRVDANNAIVTSFIRSETMAETNPWSVLRALNIRQVKALQRLLSTAIRQLCLSSSFLSLVEPPLRLLTILLSSYASREHPLYA